MSSGRGDLPRPDEVDGDSNRPPLSRRHPASVSQQSTVQRARLAAKARRREEQSPAPTSVTGELELP